MQRTILFLFVVLNQINKHWRGQQHYCFASAFFLVFLRPSSCCCFNGKKKIFAALLLGIRAFLCRAGAGGCCTFVVMSFKKLSGWPATFLNLVIPTSQKQGFRITVLLIFQVRRWLPRNSNHCKERSWLYPSNSIANGIRQNIMVKTATLGSFENSSYVTKHRYGPIIVRMNISLSNNVFDHFSLKAFWETSTGLARNEWTIRLIRPLGSSLMRLV